MLARILFASVLFLLSGSMVSAAPTTDDAPIALVLENHHFTPSTFTVTGVAAGGQDDAR